jgi:hypothetical protein
MCGLKRNVKAASLVVAAVTSFLLAPSDAQAFTLVGTLTNPTGIDGLIVGWNDLQRAVCCRPIQHRVRVHAAVF